MRLIEAKNSLNQTQPLRFFVDPDALGFYERQNRTAEGCQQMLTFKVARTPKCLMAHVERIYLCFHEHLSEQLFGALVDLLIVLNHSGSSLAKRMVTGAKSRLPEDQYLVLENYLADPTIGVDALPAHRFSVFSKGLFSSIELVKPVG